MGSRKAISPIIAIVILLLLMITIAGAGYSYLGIYWTSLTGGNIQALNSFCAGGNMANVLVKNTGTLKISLADVRVMNASTNTQISNPTWTNLEGTQVIEELEAGKTARFSAYCIGHCTYRFISGGMTAGAQTIPVECRFTMIEGALNIYFGPQTPPNGWSQFNNDIFVDVSASGDTNISTFIDFDNSLVGWWRMDDVSGTTVIDYMGRNNGTTMYDATQVSNGKFGKGWYFDGYRDYIYISGDDINLTGMNATINAWIKMDNLGDSHPIIDLAGAGNGHCMLVHDPSSGWSFKHRPPGGSSTTTVTEGSVSSSIDTWYHIALTRDGSNWTIYRDGEVLANNDDSTDFLDKTATYIGMYPDSDLSYISVNGTLDDVMIFNRSLSAKEIRGLYANTSTKYLTRNFTGLADGSHTFKAYAQDLAGNVNPTEERTVTVNAAPNTPTPVLNSTDGSNNTNQNLTCYDTLTDAEGHDMNVSVGWYKDGALNLSIDYNNSYANGTNFNTILDYRNTTIGNVWMCSLRLYDGYKYSNWGNSPNLTIIAYNTSLSVFDQEQDEESEAQSNDARVYANEWTVFYANYSSPDGYDLGQVLWRSSDLGTGYTVHGIDLNLDGIRNDFVYSEKDNIIVYYANGTQKFNKADSVFDYAYGMATGDFNDDSSPEIAFISSGGRFFILNSSDGSDILRTADFGSGHSLKNGDIDDDGRKDDFVIGASSVGGSGYGVLVYIYNETSGNFENIWNATEATSTVYEVDISEIPGEENLVGYAEYGGRLVVYYGNGSLRFDTGDLGYGLSLEFFDQDSDGKEDEVAFGEASDLRVFDENGNSLYTKTEPAWSNHETEKFDFDGDGIDDDILISSEVRIDAYDSDGTMRWTFFVPIKEYETVFTTTHLSSMKVGDINNDGEKEIIAGRFSSRYWILNSSGDIIGKHYHGFETGALDQNGIGVTYSKSTGIDIVDDINGDGIDEILSDRTSGYVYYGQQVMCKITIDGDENYMYYNYTSKLWEYYHYFNDSEFDKTIADSRTFDWDISCEKGGYQSQASSTGNVTVYLKNSSLDSFDQEDDSEDKAGWLSEHTVYEDMQTYFFANYTDLEINGSLEEMGYEVDWFSDIGGGMYDVQAIDLDGDGVSEAFVYPESDNIIAYYPNGSQAWNRYDNDYESNYNIRVGDFNNDSYEDVTGISSNGYVFVVNNTGDEIFQSADFGSGRVIGSGDVNGDGIDDIVAGATSVEGGYGIVVFAYNTGSGNFENIWNATDILTYTTEIKISEIPGEENLVGFTGRSNPRKAFVYYGNGTKSYETAALPSYVYSLEFFDYDEDGKEDELLVGESSDVFVYNETGDKVATHTSPVYQILEIETIDYDLDGYDNEYATFENYYVRLIDKDGNEKWNYHIPGSYYGMLEIYDVNNDNEPEILVGTDEGIIYVFNRTGDLLDRQNFVWKNSMSATESVRFGYYYYGAGGESIAFTKINNSVYVGFGLYNAYIGVYEIYPKCTIEFNDSVVRGMNYNISAGLYYYNRSFSPAGNYEWNITCESEHHVTRSSGVNSITVN